MRIAIVLALTISLSGCAQFLTGDIEPVPAPDFATTDVQGNPVNLTDYAGRPILLDFMGTWCGPCQRSVPILRTLQVDYPDLVVISISGTDTVAKLSDFQSQYQAPWPHIADTNGDIVRAYREAGSRASDMMWPSYGLVDRDGQLVFYNRGETLPATFTSALDGIAERQSPTVSAWPLLGLAALLGALSWANPFLLKYTLHRDPERPRPRAAVLLPVAIFSFIGWISIAANRPLSGRVATIGGLLAVVGVLAVIYWRLTTKEVQSKRLDKDGWTHAWALQGQHLYYGVAAWWAVLHAGFLRTAPGETLLLPIAFGVGWAAMEAAAWSPKVKTQLVGLGDKLGWIGAAGILMGAAWNGLLWIR